MKWVSPRSAILKWQSYGDDPFPPNTNILAGLTSWCHLLTKILEVIHIELGTIHTPSRFEMPSFHSQSYHESSLHHVWYQKAYPRRVRCLQLLTVTRCFSWKSPAFLDLHTPKWDCTNRHEWSHHSRQWCEEMASPPISVSCMRHARLCSYLQPLHFGKSSGQTCSCAGGDDSAPIQLTWRVSRLGAEHTGMTWPRGCSAL